jgi:hydrogenase nickel incorporation protein HypA/HybF
MHELSLALEVVELTRREAEKHRVSIIKELEIEVGYLSGVEADAFQSALELIVKETILENATIQIIRTPGNGFCRTCDNDFLLNQPLDTCPVCGNYPTRVWGGNEFRVKSMLAE